MKFWRKADPEWVPMFRPGDPEWTYGFFKDSPTHSLRVAQAAIEKILWDRYWNQ